MLPYILKLPEGKCRQFFTKEVPPLVLLIGRSNHGVIDHCEFFPFKASSVWKTGHITLMWVYHLWQVSWVDWNFELVHLRKFTMHFNQRFWWQFSRIPLSKSIKRLFQHLLRICLKLEIWVLFKHLFPNFKKAHPCFVLLTCNLFLRLRIAFKFKRLTKWNYCLHKFKVFWASIIWLILKLAGNLSNLVGDGKTFFWIERFDLETFFWHWFSIFGRAQFFKLFSDTLGAFL